MEDDRSNSRDRSRPHNRERPGVHPTNERSAARGRAPGQAQRQRPFGRSPSPRRGEGEPGYLDEKPISKRQRKKLNKVRGKHASDSLEEAIKESRAQVQGQQDAQREMSAQEPKDKDQRSDAVVEEQLHGEAELKLYYPQAEAARIGRAASEAVPLTNRTLDSVDEWVNQEPTIRWDVSHSHISFRQRLMFISSYSLIALAVHGQQQAVRQTAAGAARIVSYTTLLCFTSFWKLVTLASPWNGTASVPAPVLRIASAHRTLAHVVAAPFTQWSAVVTKFDRGWTGVLVFGAAIAPIIYGALRDSGPKDKRFRDLDLIPPRTSLLPIVNEVLHLRPVAKKVSFAFKLAADSVPDFIAIPVRDLTKNLCDWMGFSKRAIGWKSVILWQGMITTAQLCTVATMKLLRFWALCVGARPHNAGELKQVFYESTSFGYVLYSGCKTAAIIGAAWWIFPRIILHSSFKTYVKVPTLNQVNVMRTMLLRVDFSMQTAQAKQFVQQFKQIGNIDVRNVEWHKNERCFDGVGGQDPRTLPAQNRSMRIITPLITQVGLLTIRKDWVSGIGSEYRLLHRECGKVSLAALVSVIDGASFASGGVQTVLDAVHRDAATYHKSIGLPRMVNMDAVWTQTLRLLHDITIENVSARDRHWYDPADFPYGAAQSGISGATRFPR